MDLTNPKDAVRYYRRQKTRADKLNAITTIAAFMFPHPICVKEGKAKVKALLIAAGCIAPAKDKRGRPQEMDYESIERLYRAGYSDGQIADAVAVSRAAICNWRSRLIRD